MEQLLQQWRFIYGIDDNAFESLIAILSAHDSSLESFSFSSRNVAPNMLTLSFFSDVNGSVPEQNEATSNAPVTSQLWEPQMDSIPFPASEDFLVPNAGVAPPSNVIVPEPVEDSAWSPIAAQKENRRIACIKCWVEKKKVNASATTRQGHRWLTH